MISLSTLPSLWTFSKVAACIYIIGWFGSVCFATLCSAFFPAVVEKKLDMTAWGFPEAIAFYLLILVILLLPVTIVGFGIFKSVLSLVWLIRTEQVVAPNR